MTEIQNLMNWISNQGFAIAIASVLILRIDSKLDKLINKIEQLCVEVRKNKDYGDPFGG